MTLSIRSKNILFLRAFFDGQLNGLTNALSSITNQAALIKMGQGEKEITDEMARSIERTLDLPTYWLDRENEKLVRMMSDLEYGIYEKVKSMSEEKKRALSDFLIHKQ